MASDLQDVSWGKEEAQSKNSTSTNLLDYKKLDQLVQHTFPASLGWVPERIEINGRKGRQVVCILGKDKKQYRIYDLDSDNGVEGSTGKLHYDSGDNMVT